jgi:hypothetical protein
MTANKSYAAVISGGIVTVVCWALNTYAHAAIPDLIQGTVTTLIMTALVFFVPNTAKVSS